MADGTQNDSGNVGAATDGTPSAAPIDTSKAGGTVPGAVVNAATDSIPADNAAAEASNSAQEGPNKAVSDAAKDSPASTGAANSADAVSVEEQKPSAAAPIKAEEPAAESKVQEAGQAESDEPDQAQVSHAAADNNDAPGWLKVSKSTEKNSEEEEEHVKTKEEIAAEREQEKEAYLSQINREFEEKSTIQKAKEIGLPYVYISKTPINMDLLRLVDAERAEKALLMPFFKVGKKLRVAVVDPASESVKAVLQELANNGYEVQMHLASHAGMLEALKLYGKRQHTFKKEVVETLDEDKLAAYEKEIDALKDIKEKLQSVSSEEALNLIDVGAIKTGASDVHYEPEEKVTVIRFRIDGVLHQVFEIDHDVYVNIVNQIKYKSKMKLNINNVPQDGRYSFRINQRDIDVRVSTLPTQYGETFVCRYLDSKKGFLTFEELGFSGQHLKDLAKLTNLSHGMVLVTGPTGSGKTTSLYSMLNVFKKPENKIVTLEDPVEYHLKGISQSQINEKREYTFASGLRAILRQDPDVVMLGEIRDLETAETAAQAALTGHVLLSTLHTNSAIESIPRLVNMGLPPFMIAPSLSAIIAQRLVRKICDACHTMEEVNKSEIEDLQKTLEKIKSVRKELDVQLPQTLPKANGCEKCSNTGYQGRIVVAEILMVDFEIRDAILNKESSIKIIEYARRKGMLTMREDGVLKVIAGLTSLEEVYRVTNISG